MGLRSILAGTGKKIVQDLGLAGSLWGKSNKVGGHTRLGAVRKQGYSGTSLFFIVIFAILWQSGTKFIVSPRHACTLKLVYSLEITHTNTNISKPQFMIYKVGPMIILHKFVRIK